MIAIDTNVFIYAFDATEPDKQIRARAFFQRMFASEEATVVPWQVAAELLARFRKWEAAGKMTGDDVRARFGEFLNVWRLALPTVEVFQVSFQIRALHSLSHWDSLLIAACKAAGASGLYSEDMQHGAVYSGVEIVNPFH
ncbi:MAG: PIN domain-containing protein [Thermoguttaceae bacterium]